MAKRKLLCLEAWGAEEAIPQLAHPILCTEMALVSQEALYLYRLSSCTPLSHRINSCQVLEDMLVVGSRQMKSWLNPHLLISGPETAARMTRCSSKSTASTLNCILSVISGLLVTLQTWCKQAVNKLQEKTETMPEPASILQN